MGLDNRWRLRREWVDVVAGVIFHPRSRAPHDDFQIGAAVSADKPPPADWLSIGVGRRLGVDVKFAGRQGDDGRDLPGVEQDGHPWSASIEREHPCEGGKG